jgi:hypothetical protein
VGFSIESHLHERNISATVNLPSPQFGAVTKIRLRTPRHRPLKSVRLNGKPWTNFDAKDETITIPPRLGPTLRVIAEFEPD